MISSGPQRRIVALVLMATAVLVIGYAVYSSLVLSKAVTSNKLSSLYAVSAGPLQGQSLPTFSLGKLEGSGAISSSSLVGHETVINFFASWCVPCQIETPMLAKFAQSHVGQVHFVGVDEADTKGAARSFVARSGVSYPVGFDPTKSLASSFDLVGLPTTLFVSPNGKVQSEVIGQLNEKVLLRDFKKLSGSGK